MSTRLNISAKHEALAKLDELLSSGVKFVDCPLTDDEIQGVWRSVQDPAYLNSIETLRAHMGGGSVDYLLMDDDAEFYAVDYEVDDDGKYKLLKPGATLIRFKLPSNGFNKYSRKQAVDGPTVWAMQPGASKKHALDKKLVVSHSQLRLLLGEEKFDGMLQWMEACSIMARDLTTSKKVVRELFDMIKTSGQLKRMVPDMFQYIPEAQRAAFDDQKRASSYPFEWPGYPRADVDTLMTTLLKCHLMKGTVRERRKNVHIDQPGNWCYGYPDAHLKGK